MVKKYKTTQHKANVYKFAKSFSNLSFRQSQRLAEFSSATTRICPEEIHHNSWVSLYSYSEDRVNALLQELKSTAD